MTVIPQIYDIIDKNPNKGKILRKQAVDTETTNTWDAFSMKPVEPSGPLSLFLWTVEPLFSVATPSLRKQLLTEKLLELHDRIDKELIGRRWPRKKIHDVLATQVSAGTPSESPLLLEVLSELFQKQLVVLNRKTKSISFYPPDIRCWTNEREVQVCCSEFCWFYEPLQETSFLPWLTQKEEEHWKIFWPTADGKLEDLKAKLTAKGLTAHSLPGSESTKPKKEDWARCLGRAEAISTLHSLGLTIQ